MRSNEIIALPRTCDCFIQQESRCDKTIPRSLHDTTNEPKTSIPPPQPLTKKPHTTSVQKPRPTSITSKTLLHRYALR